MAFSRIKKQNSSISIRGLAIKLGISHVFLSKVLAGKSPVPESRLKSFIKIFQLDSLAEKELKDAMIADLSVSEKIDKILQFKKNTKKKKTIEFFQEQHNRRLIINFSIATNTEKIQEAKQRLSQFLYNLSLEMSDTHSNEVYHLTLGLVPLTPLHHGK